MIRVNVVTEGQTEMFFVKRVLNQYFAGDPILDSRCVRTSRDRRTNREYRGGLTTYAQALNDISNWLKSDSDAYVTTMFDYYRLPNDFPQYAECMNCTSDLKRVVALERALAEDIYRRLPGVSSERFVPYIQLHEFETLLFTDVTVLKKDYLDDRDISAIDDLYESTKMIPPEDINDGPETAPSKRLLNAIDYRKGELPAEWLNAITVEKVIEKCPHFAEWINQISQL